MKSIENWFYNVLVSVFIIVGYLMLTAAQHLMQLALETYVLESKLIKSMDRKLYPSMITLK